MDKFSRSILLVATLYMSAALGDCADATEQDQIFEYVRYNQKIDKEVREALLNLELNSEDLASGSRINEVMYKTWMSSTKFPMTYKTLQAGWPTQKDGDCSRDIVDHCLSILSQDELKPFRTFVGYYESKLSNCAKKQMDSIIANSKAFSLFDVFFKAGLFPKKKIDDQAYLDGLMEFHTRLDGLHMVEAGKALMKKKFPYPRNLGKDHSMVVTYFLHNQCRIFTADYRKAFNLINMVEILHPTNLSQRFRILNEYNRICLAWTTDEKRNHELHLTFSLLD